MNTIDQYKYDFTVRRDFLVQNSQYQSDFNWNAFVSFHETHSLGIGTKNGVELINNYVGCENCHTGFQIDTYLDGCTHDCSYCFAKIEGERNNQWNNPFPVPLDITHIWKQLYLTFEAGTKEHQLSPFLEKRVPLRIGSLSDPFIPLEKKLHITKELITLLNYYKYPYLIITRSDLVSEKEYLEILNPELSSVHISIPSLNAEKTKLIEPGAPSPQRRIETIRILREEGIWVTARINPLFPVLKDESLSSGMTFSDVDESERLDFYTDQLVIELSKVKCQSILVGFVSLRSSSLDELSDKIGFPLRSLMKNEKGDFYFSEKEISSYFKHIHKLSRQYEMDFTTCYLGQESGQYFKNQNLWSNKKDCCNVLNKVSAHETTSLSIDRQNNLKGKDISKSLLHKVTLKLLQYILKAVDKK
jgi:DNA repair photolyase